MPRTPAPAVDLRRAADRYLTRTSWLESRHAFSTGPHYDASNTSFGLLLAHDEHRLRAGTGFPDHRHRDVEVVTWVVEGALRHRDSAGHEGVVRPGRVQRMSAGSGVLHAEHADADAPVHLVQAWVVPDEPGGPPGYAQRDLDDDLRGGALVPVASGLPRHADGPAVLLGSSSAALSVARLPPGGAVALPQALFLHVFVVRGEVVLEDAGDLAAGDTARLTADGGRRLTAAGAAEVLVWEMHAPGR